MKIKIILLFFIMSSMLSANPWEFIPAQGKLCGGAGSNMCIDSKGKISMFYSPAYREPALHTYHNGTFSKQDSIFVGFKSIWFRYFNDMKLDINDNLIIDIGSADLFHQKDSLWLVYNRDLPSFIGAANDCTVLPSGETWFACFDGLIKYSKGKYTKYLDQEGVHDFNLNFQTQLFPMKSKLLVSNPSTNSLMYFNNLKDYKTISYERYVMLSEDGMPVLSKYTKAYKIHDNEIILTFNGGQALIFRGDSVHKSLHIARDCPVDTIVSKRWYAQSLILDCLKDHEGNYWFIYKEGGRKRYIVRYSKDWQWEQITFPGQTDDSDIDCMSMELAPDGRIWFSAGKPKAGFYIYDPSK